MISFFWLTIATLFILFLYHTVLSSTKKIIIFIIPILSIITYLKIGNYYNLKNYYNLTEIKNREENKKLRKIANQIIQKEVSYKVKLEINPNDLSTLTELAKLYITTNSNQNALDTLERCLYLSPDNLEFLSLYLSQSAKNNYGAIPQSLIPKLEKLKNIPEYMNIYYNMKAFNYFNDKQYKKAKENWEIVLKRIKNNSNKKYIDNIKTLIKKAEKYQDTKSVVINLSVSENLEYDKNQTVFVTAKAIGNNMPLAVLKRKSFDLPSKVTLGLIDSMMENWDLDSANEIVIEARISSIDDATPQKGDLIGKIITSKNEITLKINETLS